MHNQNNRPRLHPLQWVAALSVIGFSAVGIAALTGAMPRAAGHQEMHSESRMAAAEASTAPASETPPPTPESKARPAPTRTPAPAANATPAPASRATPACAECGVVESITPVQVAGQGSGAGVIAGGVIGGVLGNQVGKGSGRDLATIGAAVLGGIAGNEIEKKARSQTAYDVAVRLDDGGREVLRLNGAPAVRTGDRVALRDGELKPAGPRGG